jgi:hypothetical protein
MQRVRRMAAISPFLIDLSDWKTKFVVSRPSPEKKRRMGNDQLWCAKVAKGHPVQQSLYSNGCRPSKRTRQSGGKPGAELDGPPFQPTAIMATAASQPPFEGRKTGISS